MINVSPTDAQSLIITTFMVPPSHSNLEATVLSPIPIRFSHACNIYNITGTQIGAFTLIILFIYGTEVSRAYNGASLQIAGVISYSSFLAFALYPKLLEKINQEDVTTSLKMVFRFAIPMTTGAIILADSYLTILIKVYNEATLVLQLLASNIICLTFL